MRIWKKILLLMLLVLLMPVQGVHAAKERAVTVEDKLYYYTTTSGNKYGSYYGTSSATNASRYTRYKHINNNPAYCVQSEDLAPASGATYVEVEATDESKYWSTKDKWVTGFIIQLIDEKLSGNEAYVMTYAALNSYLTNPFGGKNFSAHNTEVAGFINDAEEQYEKYFTEVLPNFSATATKKLLTKYTSGNTVKYRGSLKLSGLYSDFGGTHIYGDETDDVTYTITSTSDKLKFCSDSSCKSTSSSLTYKGISGEKTIYVEASNVSPGDNLSVKITASNESYYHMGRLWEPKTGNSQILLGKGYEDAGHLKRSRVKTVNFTVPDPDKKKVVLTKIDASSGNLLRGASLELKLSGGVTKSCSISGNNYSCEIEITEETTDDIYYSVVEKSAPDGYILGSKIENAKWDIGASTSTCYIVSGEETKETDMSDCQKIYSSGDLCEKTSGVYTKGACIEVPDTTGLILGEDGNYYSEETGELVENIPTKPDGTNHLDVCYYDLNGSIGIESDKSKCTNQYTQVTNSGSNLIIEYYNNKNRVEISKYDINGEEELRGAELKICATEPDADGNCTIARNTLDGQCVSSSTSEEGYLNISDDVNCVNNDDGTKTVDMHWVSGISSKVWYGVKARTYWLVETVSPKGYLPLTTAIEFSIDENGKITSEAYNEEAGKIIIRNQPTKFSVSKVATNTGKSLEGASLSICSSYKDENGNYQMRVGESGFCIPAVLAGNEPATWTSTSEAKVIEGLSTGTYYLVELEAPEGYTISDPVLFTLHEDGSVTDKDGNVVKDNMLVMKDDPFKSEQLGEIPVLTIILIGAASIAVCGGSYYCLVVKNGFEEIKNKFKKKK